MTQLSAPLFTLISGNALKCYVCNDINDDCFKNGDIGTEGDCKEDIGQDACQKITVVGKA